MIASPQQGYLRPSDFPSGQGAGDKDRTLDRRVPEDLRTISPPTVPSLERRVCPRLYAYCLRSSPHPGRNANHIISKNHRRQGQSNHKYKVMKKKPVADKKVYSYKMKQ
ncbi:hypothetical protein PoB_006340200 [Plakobranchus ocellatus]|uniref:Uncharacterized protein n=1 Tax=Plakobranchus ocellatus TaxID=259542 RepID=A0AAV4CYB0_9GAST|nr:hypothetical protein PoB_006340200 [Plakobranchus ocellatus]